MWFVVGFRNFVELLFEWEEWGELIDERGGGGFGVVGLGGDVVLGDEVWDWFVIMGEVWVGKDFWGKYWWCDLVIVFNCFCFELFDFFKFDVEFDIFFW